VDESPPLDLLLPPGRTIAPDPAEHDLVELYAEPASPWVRANMIATLDGAATGADHRSGSINHPADRRVFQTLRARADVVLVGADTVRTEGYRAPRTPDDLLAGRRGRQQGDHPELAVVTAGGVLPDALLAEDPAPWVFTTSSAASLDNLRARLPSDRLVVADGALDLADVIATLVAAGLGRILTEGGPHLLGELMAAHLVDELCLTWSPQLVGGPAVRVLAGIDWLEPPTTAHLSHLLHSDGVLLGRWLLR
jgi:riboflavin biosynthesis pyrimidine reductase